MQAQPGDLVQIAEKDYQYGIGVLTLRVTAIRAIARDAEWVDVRGFEIGWNGERRSERQVRVRVSALTRMAQR